MGDKPGGRTHKLAYGMAGRERGAVGVRGLQRGGSIGRVER